MDKYIFWGAGDVGKKCYDEFEKYRSKTGDELIYFVDNDSSKWGQIYCGVPVLAPFEIMNIDYDYLVISCLKYDEIFKQIVEMNICDKCFIKTSPIYTEELIYTKEQYHKRYNETINCKENELIEDIIVYTAIIGGYDLLKEPEYVSPHIKYVCFTDNKTLKSNTWEIRYIEDETLSNVKLARKIKILPYEFLNNEESKIVVWVDGKCQIKSDLRAYIRKYQKNKGMLCFPHMFRDCILDEVIELSIIKPEQKRESFIQLGKYLEEGIPFNNGLYETSCIVRDMEDVMIKKLMYQWWEEVNAFSYRDQISLPYIFWKNGYKPDICDMNVEKNAWLEKTEHL